MPPEKSGAYLAIYYAWIGLVGGLAPLLAGSMLSATGGWHGRIGPVTLDGYAALFAVAGILLTLGWAPHEPHRSEHVAPAAAAAPAQAAQPLPAR